jgi:hypothetical protein
MWAISWQILCESAIYILVGFLIAGFLQVWVAGERVIRWLSQRRPRSVFLATMFGVPLPLCSCSVLPTAVTLNRKGASKGATLSFLISTPETSAQSILLTYSLLGPLMAVFRPIAACITALCTGLTQNLVEARFPPPMPADSESADDSNANLSGADATRPAPAAGRFRTGLRYAFVDLFDDIFIWIVIGIVAAAAIQAFLPSALFGALFSGTFASMLLMLIIGIPLYICAESSTPIAAVLVAQGINPGAALVLLLAGPATNIGSVGVLYRELGRRTIVIYLATIAVFTLLLGALLNLLAAWFPQAWQVRAFGEPFVPEWLKVAGAVGFIVAGLLSLHRQRYWPRAIAWLDAKLPVRVSQRRVLSLAGALLVLWYLGTGFFMVQPGEVGVIRRFGAIVQADSGPKLHQPGWHYAWPYPIDRVDRVPVERVYRTVLGLARNPQDPLVPETNPREAWLLIGDENIADIKAAVHWCAKPCARDPEQVINFRYRIEWPDKLVRDATMGAMREVLGGASINRAFTTRRYDYERDIEALIQNRLDAYESGIQVDSFHFLDAHAPPEVHEAFRDVASALEDKSTEINLARAQENRVVPLARGEAVRTRAAAQGYAALTVSQSTGAAARFLDIWGVYQQWPEVTGRRMYFETLDVILPGTRKYIKTTGAGSGEIEIWLVDPRVGGNLPWQPGADMR